MEWMGRRVDGKKNVKSRDGEWAVEGLIRGLVDRSMGRQFDWTGYVEDEHMRDG